MPIVVEKVGRGRPGSEADRVDAASQTVLRKTAEYPQADSKR